MEKKTPSSSRGLSKNKYTKVCSNRVCRPKKNRKVSSMAKIETKVIIEITDSPPSSDEKGTPLRPVFCLKNRDQIKKAEENEECFILEYDPYDNSEKLNSLSFEDFDTDEDDLYVVGENGKVACRDYPHPRHTCAKYIFEKTPHDSHCEMCYCYVCDLSAPCSKWVGSSGHCHAFNNEAWDQERKSRREEVTTV